MRYLDYLNSERWHTLRSSAMHLAGWRCQLCNGAEIQLEVHHRSYANLRRPAEISDLITLCADCHDLMHAEGKLPRPPSHTREESMAAMKLIAQNQRKAREWPIES